MREKSDVLISEAWFVQVTDLKLTLAMHALGWCGHDCPSVHVLILTPCVPVCMIITQRWYPLQWSDSDSCCCCGVLQSQQYSEYWLLLRCALDYRECGCQCMMWRYVVVTNTADYSIFISSLFSTIIFSRMSSWIMSNLVNNKTDFTRGKFSTKQKVF